jgi:hypothetical protein
MGQADAFQLAWSVELPGAVNRLQAACRRRPTFAAATRLSTAKLTEPCT